MSVLICTLIVRVALHFTTKLRPFEGTEIGGGQVLRTISEHNCAEVVTSLVDTSHGAKSISREPGLAARHPDVKKKRCRT